jgi:hypothetical protein
MACWPFVTLSSCTWARSVAWDLSDGKRRKPVGSAMNSGGSGDYSRLRMDPIWLAGTGAAMTFAPPAIFCEDCYRLTAADDVVRRSHETVLIAECRCGHVVVRVFPTLCSRDRSRPPARDGASRANRSIRRWASPMQMSVRRSPKNWSRGVRDGSAKKSASAGLSNPSQFIL